MTMTIVAVAILVAFVCILIAIAAENKRKDEQKYLALLEIYKSNGGQCYKSLRLDATEEERVAWERQEKINKRALELSGLESLRAGSYIHFRNS